MKTSVKLRREQAVALIIVLAMLLLLSGLIVSFMTTVSTERAGSSVNNSGLTTRQLADSTVSFAIGQIRQATTQAERASVPTTWASQPGAIRTLSGTVGPTTSVSTGTPAATVKQFTYKPGPNDYVFKLFSSAKMKIAATDLAGKAWDPEDIDVIEKWDRTKSEAERTKSGYAGYVDLNEPILTPLPGSISDKNSLIVDPRYPIVDPRAKFDQVEKPNPSANPGIVDGFDIKTTGLSDAKLQFYKRDGAGNKQGTQAVQYLPMPVKWLYVMRDGSMAAADSSSGKIPGASLENPIVGRTAFWADDESCRLNINTASEGTYWETPTASSELVSGNVDGGKSLTSSTTSLSLGAAQPAKGEYQRYPGHPATTSLSPVLGWLWNILPTQGPRPTRDTVLVGMKEGIVQLSPFTPYGRNPPPFYGSTSMAASFNPDPELPPKPLPGQPAIFPRMNVATKRLYTTVDELIFKSVRNTSTSNPPTKTVLNSDKLTPEALEKLRFFLTTYSRAPELNLFGRPRVTFWPVHVKPELRTGFDDLFAFTSTLYKDPSGVRDNTFYFTRIDAKNSANDFAIGKNPDIFNYLKLMTGDGPFTSIPGFGGSFANKYPGGEKDQILQEIFDYCRCMNLVDTSERNRSGKYYPYTPFYGGTNQGAYPDKAVHSNEWSGQVTPLRVADAASPAGFQGLGRFPMISEAAIVFYSPVQGKVQALLLFEMATPMAGYPGLRETFWTRVTVERPTLVTGAKVDGLPSDDIQLVGGPPRINIVNVPSHDAGNGRAFMPILGFLNQMCYYPETPTRPTDINDPTVAKPDPNWQPNRKTFDWDNGVTDSTLEVNYKRNKSVTFYPYVSKQFTPAAGALKFSGGAYKVEIFAGEAPDDHRSDVGGQRVPVQTVHLNFPPAEITATVPTAVDSFQNRVTAQLDANATNVIRATDVVRSIEFVGPATALPQQGDVRLGMARREVPASWYKERNPGTGSGQYFGSSLQVHGLCVGHGDPVSGYQASTRGMLAAGGTARGSKPPILPAGINGVQEAGGGPGDWDRGLSKHVDGAMGNKVDEGNVYFEYGINSVGNAVPYYRGRAIEETGQSFFSPNRQCSSAVMFGSMPTGVVRGLPWQTLLFRPDRSTKSHPGAQTAGAPADHLLLDLFNLPVVEPYAISEPFSTAGKVNLNYVIAPFGYAKGEAGNPRTGNLPRSYLRRDTGLRGIFKAVKVMAVPTAQADGAHAEAPVNVSTQFHFDIDAERTLDQFESRFKDPSRGLFRSASEICDMDLYPLGLSVTNWATFWDSQYAQTGDNMRERPYSHIYPRVTTKSNVFTIYMRCQAVKKVPGTAPDEFDGKRDKVLAEYRGQATVERFIDPNDAQLKDYDATSGTSSVDPYYRFRVISTKQFLPR